MSFVTVCAHIFSVFLTTISLLLLLRINKNERFIRIQRNKIRFCQNLRGKIEFCRKYLDYLRIVRSRWLLQHGDVVPLGLFFNVKSRHEITYRFLCNGTIANCDLGHALFCGWRIIEIEQRRDVASCDRDCESKIDEIEIETAGPVNDSYWKSTKKDSGLQLVPHWDQSGSFSFGIRIRIFLSLITFWSENVRELLVKNNNRCSVTTTYPRWKRFQSNLRPMSHLQIVTSEYWSLTL